MSRGLGDVYKRQIGDKLVNYLEPKERDLAMVFQSYALYPQMNIYDNIAFSLQVRKVPKKEIDKKVHHVAELLGLENLLKQRPKNLSGGQRQALSLLMATLKRPELLLLDEHTAALDPKTSVALMELTDEFVTGDHLTALMITHHMEDALKYGNRLIVMKDGQIIKDLTKEEKGQLDITDYYAMFE